ncbi:response regulator transcription factor [Corynebacterium kefirresidentii]|uniref:response regulator transcription factor n=1 Tax=Corynebacterium TaxID=1716 RepID=UPI001EF334EB|nr:response regulator transcription factor [Corynebacterium kefirresidentii]MCG7450499.1 response regulator transcription factor [Corynebacterium kefirresidentii]MCG7452737.1 response regulator transcription factor [Corynebacterium kefirresidentii]MDN8633262.1 response regulator transcription factor [Corynebacterium kefirresidentii]
MPETIRVLIAEDQSLVRGALVALLETEPDISVVAQCATGAEVAGLVAKHSVDVALLDIEMPGKNGLDAAAELQGTGCRSLIVTTFGRGGYVKRALETGVSGFVVKDTPPEKLAEDIRRVHSGLKVIDPALAQETIFIQENPLNTREQEVAKFVLQGSGTHQIARKVHLSNGTVRNIVSSLIAKTAAENRFEAATIAQAQGWL